MVGVYDGWFDLYRYLERSRRPAIWVDFLEEISCFCRDEREELRKSVGSALVLLGVTSQLAMGVEPSAF